MVRTVSLHLERESDGALMAYKITSRKYWAETEQEIAWCFDKWRIRDWEVLKNVMGSRTHSRIADRTERAVSVRFIKAGKPVTLTIDSQERPVDNLRALYLCLDDMRMLEVRGLADTIQSAYMQLAAPAAERDPHEVLGLRPGATAAEVEAMFRAKAKQLHPDAGGSEAAMAELNAARDKLLRSVE